MAAPIKDNKNQNAINLFLNEYFNIITLVVVIFALILSYFIVIRPKYVETIDLIKVNLEQQQKLYKSQQIKLNNLKMVADLYKKIPAADLKKFNSVLPNNYIKERLFGELEEIITQNGFILSSVQIMEDKEENKQAQPAPAVENEDGTVTPAAPTPVTPVSNIGTINLQVNITAIDYAGLKNLLRTLENNLRLFDVTKVSFSPNGNSATLMLSTYYYKK